MNQRVSVIGVGLMGAAMSQALHAGGFDVVGFDISADHVSRAKKLGIAMADTAAAAVGEADFIVSSLPNSAAVRAAWLGKEGILSSARSGAVAIEMSSIDPDTMKELGDACRQRGIAPLDVPVSGGPDEAASGKLVLLVGGDEEDADRARPVLSALGKTHLATGAIGTAKIVKLVNNVMTMGNVLVAAEAFALGTAAGVEPERLYEVLSQSGGRSHHFIKRFPKALRKDYAPGFSMQLGEKDVALAIEFARSIGSPMPMASMIREMMMIAFGLGYRDKDIVALLDMYQRIAGDGGFASETSA